MSGVTVAGLADLVHAALPDEHLSAADLLTCCGGEGSVTLGDGDGAAVVNVTRFETERRAGRTPGSPERSRPDDASREVPPVAWILLLAVAPERQREGRGRALVDEAAEYARDQGARELHLGNAVPRYVWPGVDFRLTAALALFESCGFDPYGAEVNMAIPTSFRVPVPEGAIVTRENGDGAVRLAARIHPHWADEVGRATAGGTCFVARDIHGATLGFACHSVNRHALIGPMATDPGRRGLGIGGALLSALCTDLRDAHGLEETEISWVGPIGFYAKAGARVSRVFRTARLAL